MLKTLAFFRKNLVWNIPIAMILGLIAGYFFQVSFLQSWIPPS